MSDPVPPIVHEAHLRLLLAEQHESEILDYKSELDLVAKESKARAAAEIVKDVAAMASGRGGHLVIGVDGRGVPSGALEAEHCDQLDEARLRPRLERYLPDGIEIRTATHQIDGSRVVLIHVAPHPDGLVVIKADGAYVAGGKEKKVFREGDIFVRRGTESTLLGQAELRRFLRELRQQVEAEARAEALRSVAPHLQQIAESEAISSGAAERLSWDLDRATLISAVTDQLRRGDEVPVRLLLDGAPRAATRILRRAAAEEGADPEEAAAEARSRFGALLDKIVALAARGLVIDSEPLVGLAIEALGEIYDIGFDQHGVQRGDLLVSPARLWLDIVERVYGLGGLAVRKRRWSAVKALGVRTPASYHADLWKAWLRHAHIMAARANLLAHPDYKRAGASVLKLALEQVVAIPELHPDLEADDERLLDSLAQFDLLLALAVSGAHARVSDALIWPHFKRFYGHRSDPAVVLMIEDIEARETIFPYDDQELADALRRLARIGGDEFFWVNGWDSFEDRRILQFLEEHPAVDGG